MSKSEEKKMLVEISVDIYIKNFSQVVRVSKYKS